MHSKTRKLLHRKREGGGGGGGGGRDRDKDKKTDGQTKKEMMKVMMTMVVLRGGVLFVVQVCAEGL